MSATLALEHPSTVIAHVPGLRLPSRLPRDGWKAPLTIAIGLHIALLLVGYLSRHDTLLDLIAKGESPAVLPVDPQPVQEVEIVDLTPPPPPEANPDFVTPQKVEVPQPKPKPQPPVVAASTAKAIQFAPSTVVIGDKNFPKPQYPYEAKLRHYQGTVTISLNIVDGQILSADVAGSSGYAILDTAASSWIRQRWHFPPDTTRNFSLPVQFQLTSG